MTTPEAKTYPDPEDGGLRNWMKLYLDFFSLRFPRLKALQWRNCVVTDTALPPPFFLFDKVDGLPAHATACIDFMEAHSNLQCLAWPMDGFFSASRKISRELATRVDAIITNLSRTLVDLRVDTMFRSRGEPQTDSVLCPDINARISRRRFIEEFASKMAKLESIKVEGGIPRDERREVVRALHACPLQKIVMIGVTCPRKYRFTPYPNTDADALECSWQHLGQ
jgi:hypothetical protein